MKGVGEVLGLDKQKMTEGKELIKYFYKIVKATKSNERTNLPKDAPEKWGQFKTYCIRDVDVENRHGQRLAKFPIPKGSREIYCLIRESMTVESWWIVIFVNHAVACDLFISRNRNSESL